MRDTANQAGRNPEAIELTAMVVLKSDASRRSPPSASRVFGPPSRDPAKLPAGLERIANDVIVKL